MVDHCGQRKNGWRWPVLIWIVFASMNSSNPTRPHFAAVAAVLHAAAGQLAGAVDGGGVDPDGAAAQGATDGE
jgi:hypothetical protein